MGSEQAITLVLIPILLWRRVILELRRRGGGRRESGAFFLGPKTGPVVKSTKFICYDDLDPNAYQGGGINFHDEGYAALWTLCRNSGLTLLADVHTHPGGNVGQSSIDQRNPMIPVVGHTAIIVPRYARTNWFSLDAVGVYEYLGNYRWRSHPAGPHRRAVLTLW